VLTSTRACIRTPCGVAGNTITNPVSCGVYVAGARNLEIVENRISGQSDRHDATLPKGAIALNHAEHVSDLRDNELTGNYIGISSVGSSINMGTNRISEAAGGVRQKIR
jgi:nitrous oxidase accessory protein NosD